MQTRNNKPKKGSKLKHTVTCYNSPSKVSISTGLSSGCCPKQPPNISYHHLEKKRQQIKGEYYNVIVGKQNKGRIMNHVAQRDHSSILQTDRLKEKRNTHNQITYEMISHSTQGSKLLDPKRNTHNHTKHTDHFTLNSSKLQHNYLNEHKYNLPDPGHKYANFHEVNKHMNESKYFNEFQQNRNLKTVSKKKLVVRQPIALKPMKSNKNRFVRQNDNKESARNQKHQKERLLKKDFKLRPSIIAQNEQSCYQCFQTINTYSVTHSKNSTANLTDLAADQQLTIVKPQNPLNRSKKPTFHKSPKILSPSASIKIIKTPEQQLAEFQAQITEINTNFEQDSLNYMLNKDFQYVQSKNLNCYLGNQMYFDWKKRATVVSWMIQVLSEIGGKRQTLANAVNIFDRYLSLTHNIPLKHMQCIAAASLLIAAKLQDKSLSAEYLSQATQQLYSQQQIMSEEFKILETLQWNVNTPTLNCWANRLALQWDVYLDHRKDLRHFDIILNNLNDIKFKNTEQKSYYNYRMLCQYVDFSIMDICTLRYQPRLISLAFIYIILLIRLNLYDKDLVASKFPTSSQFLLEKSTFNEFFSDFLRDSFSQQLEDLLPMIQYCATFVILHLNFQMPQVINQMENEDEQLHYEQFCSYQTKNQHMLQTLYQRNRDIY